MNKKQLEEHKNNPCKVVIGPFGPHYAKLVVISKRGKGREIFVQWLNERDAELAIKLTEV